MKTKLMMMGVLATVCTAIRLAAMPTEEETRKAEPVVRKMLAQERAALNSGKKSRVEVADAAMRLAEKSDSDAEKLLLMKGAFSLYVRSGEYGRAIEAIEKMRTTIPDMPDESVISIIKSSLRNVSRNEGKVLYAFLDDIKAGCRNADGSANGAANYKFNYKLEDGGAVLTGISPKPVGTLVVPDEIDGHIVTRIENYNEFSPFWGCDQLTKVVLPAGLKFGSCDGGPFMSCKSLATIDVAEGNKELTSRDGALYSKDLSTLCVYPKTRESVELPPETKKVGVCAFRGCALKTAKIPEGVEEIERWNLCECPNLELIEFPKSLKHLGVCAAYNNEKLTKIVFYGDAPRIDGGWQEVFTGAPENLVVEVRRGSKGWLGPDTIELPELWPTDQKESRPIRYMGGEVMRPMFSSMFPGWQVCPEAGREIGIVSNHRGQDNVAFVHPIRPETPAVVSRTLTLSNGNPCLFLKMASFAKDYDFLLSVLVNGKEALPKQLIRTPDSEPWQDITVPLSVWRGEKVKIDVVLAANNWYCEHPFFKRLEVAEGTGQEKLDSKLEYDAKETVNGYTWSYRVKNGEAMIVTEKAGNHSCAVSPMPTGDVSIPATLGGVKVTSIDKDAFHSCKNLTGVTMPDSVASIGGNAFYGCSNLKSTVLPKYLTIISNGMFDWCTSLTDVTIPDPVTSIGDGAFFRCAFTDITIPNTVTNIGTFAFGWCTELKSVNIPDSVTRVGAHSFSCCQGLASLKMPGRLPHIEEFAFNGCPSLASVAIPGSVTNISTCAFQNCSSLTNVTMLGERPEAMDDIFKGCGKLKAIHVPANAKSWAGMKDWFGIPLVFDGDVEAEGSGNSGQDVEYKFNYKLDNNGNAILTGMPCVSPKPEGVLIVPSIIDGHKVTKLDEHLSFVNCDKMTKLILPAGLESVGFGNFSKGCSSLADIEISKNNPNFTSFNGVLYSKDMKKVVAYPKARDKIELSPQTKIIGRAAFNGCTFKEIEVPSGIERIESHAFAEMLNLEKIVFPESVNEIWMQLFQEDSNLRKIIFVGNAPEVHIEGIYGFFAYAPENIVIEVKKGTKGWNGKDSTDIPERWPKSQFGDRDSRPIRYIGEAKAKNNGLAGANGQTATVDGYTWSYRVRNGEAMIVAEKDGNHSCAVSPAPTGDLKIPATLGGVKVTSIGEEAFRNCNDLTSVTVPEGVTHIDTHALAYCRGLQSVTLPSSLRDIGYAAFGKDAELKSVTIPNGVKSIAADAFNGCGLKSVIIPESVMHIGDRAFCACGALEAVAISAGVASIGKGVFGGCNALKLITVDSGNQAFTSIDGVLYTKDRSELVMLTNPPKSVVIPEGVTKIRGWALAVGSGMTSVTIPESVTSIEDHVFLGWDGLKSITIPSSVKNIGERAFEGCRELTEMTMLGERPEAKDLFPGCGKLKAIHVPANAKSWAGMTEWQGIPLVFDGESVNERVDAPTQEMSVVANKLKSCDFLLNKDFKKNAKYYLCLFSASWCPPCRAEMSRIAKTYAETLRDDPDIELIHFSRDQNDEKALAWAKEHDVKFPVVKPKGGNPLDLHTRGIPHLFIVKADGTLVEEGHPMKLFTDEKLRELKAANGSMAKATEKTGDVATKLFPGSIGTGLEKSLVGYWPFDGNANDATRYHNNGTLHDVTPAEDRHGNANKAYRFNGSSYIEVPHSETLNMTHAITMTAWVKPQSWWANQWIVVMQKGDQRNVNYQFAMRISDNRVYLCSDGISQRCGQLGLELNKWQQVALTYESGKNFCFYRNGALIGKWQCSQDLQPNKGSLLIGYDPFGWTEYFIGGMDDVRLFNRALSEKEIEKLYKAEVPMAGKETVDGIEWTYNVVGGEAQVDYASSSNATGAISIPSTLGGCPVTSIGRNEFRSGFGWRVFEKSCNKMTSVAIPSGVVNIGDSAFLGCSNLVSVTIPASVTNIARCAFSRCGSLTSFTVDDKNTKYSSRNGSLCSKDGSTLISGVNGDVRISPSVKDIADYAFAGRIGLKSVIIPVSVRSIGTSTFCECSGLKSVAIPASMKKIGWYAFSGCSGLMSFSVDSDNPSYSSRNGMLCSKDGSTLVVGVNGDVTIPPCVTEIGSHAFFNYSGLKSVWMPENVTSIASGAFRGCDSLMSVTIPSRVTSIGAQAFWSCKKLESVTIPASVTKIERSAFSWCSELTSFSVDPGNPSYSARNGLLCTKDGTTLVAGVNGNVTIPLGVKNIGDNSFSGCIGLTSVTIPPSVTNIGYQAFDKCEELKSVEIPSSVKSIGERAFTMCYKIKSVTIPEGVTSIGKYAFAWCYDIESVMIPHGVTSINERAFADCSGLKSVSIPTSVTSVGDNAFYNCSGLTSVTIPSSVKSIGIGAFYNCSALKTVTMPSSVTSIGRGAFAETPFYNDMPDGLVVLGGGVLCKYKGECPSSVTIPSNVTSIGENAFRGCSRLESLTIPENVKSIDGRAFVECPNLKTVHVARDGKVETMSFDDFFKPWKNVVAQRLQRCNFLFNAQFKKDAKLYLCLSAYLWNPYGINEMSRIAKIYAEKFLTDPDIELVLVMGNSRDEGTALAWGKEQDVKFPVVKSDSRNLFDMRSRGIVSLLHLFIVRADGTLVVDGSPQELFTEEKLRELKAATP